MVNIQLQLKIFTDESLLSRVLFHNILLLAFAGILRHLYYEVHRKVWKEASFDWYVNIEIFLAICVSLCIDDSHGVSDEKIPKLSLTDVT